MIVCFAGLCMIAYLTSYIAGGVRKGGEAHGGKYLVVKVDGTIIKEISIDNDTEYEVINSYGENRIIIKNREVYIDYADCPDKICVKHAPISRAGEIIVCVPHHMIISVDT